MKLKLIGLALAGAMLAACTMDGGVTLPHLLTAEEICYNHAIVSDLVDLLVVDTDGSTVAVTEVDCSVVTEE